MNQCKNQVKIKNQVHRKRQNKVYAYHDIKLIDKESGRETT